MPAVVTDKREGESWTWKVGPVSLVHRVERRRTGSEVVIEMHAPQTLEAVLAVTYGPLVGLLVSRIAAVAASQDELS